MSVEPESVENLEIKESKNSGFNTYNALIDEPCEKVFHEESSLNPHNITPNTAWSLGTETELPTEKVDYLAPKHDPDDIHCDSNKNDDELIG